MKNRIPLLALATTLLLALSTVEAFTLNPFEALEQVLPTVSSSWTSSKEVQDSEEVTAKDTEATLAALPIEPGHYRNSLSQKREWFTKTPNQYLEKTEGQGKHVFGGFNNVLNPILRKVLEERPDIKRLRDDGKIELSHHWVEMGDGKKLSTIVLNPHPVDQKKGTLLSRSPYGPTSDQIAEIFTIMNGFAAVIQDQRGTFLSEGEFSMWHEDASDGADTMAWIEQQPWSNGDVFMAGISADGCGAAAAILAQPPQLKGQLLVWASMDGHETSFPGGIFREGLVTGWMSLMSVLTGGVSLEKTLPDIIAHETLSDWWTPIQGPGHYHQATFPTVHLSAWWDIFQGHQMDMFMGISEHSPINDHYLFMGPLGHCLLGNLDVTLLEQETRGVVHAFGFASQVFNGKSLEESTYNGIVDKINVYIQGSRHEGNGDPKVGHYWSSMSKWPEASIHRLLLGDHGELIYEEPMLESEEQAKMHSLRYNDRKTTTGFAEITYDPRFPAITKGGNNLILMFLGMGCGSEDQREMEARHDVAVFTTKAPLKQPLALLGKLSAVLYVSTNRPDTDFYVSVTDVHPSGHSMQIRYGAKRMRWRESTQFRSVHSETEDGVVYKLEVDLWFSAYVLAPGHKLRISISSANTPYYAKNDNSGEDPLGFKHELQAINRVYWSDEYPSHVELPVVNMDDIPKNEKF